jgi:hypothetical protein
MSKEIGAFRDYAKKRSVKMWGRLASCQYVHTTHILQLIYTFAISKKQNIAGPWNTTPRIVV